MPLEPQLTVTAVASTGVGALMLLAGVQKHALEWRRRRRFCPSCGRQLEGGACGCTRD
jgi:NADH pyrophosphatase NudC (nudix superfamily)